MIPVYIQAVPERRWFVDGSILPSLLGLGPWCVVEDEAHRGPLANARTIWHNIRAFNRTALVLQDDVVVHHDLVKHLPDLVWAAECAGGIAVSLFAPPRKSVDAAIAKGANFLASYRFLMAQGLIITPLTASHLLDFTADRVGVPGPRGRHDDVAIRDYSNAIGMPVLVALPSLVQHDLNIKSAAGHPPAPGGRPRMTRAWWPDIPAGNFRPVRSVVER